MSNTRYFISSQYFSYFSLIFLNFKLRLYSPLKQMYGHLLVYLILKLFHPLVNSFRICYYSSYTSYLLINAIDASCAFLLQCINNPKGISLRLIIRNTKLYCFLHISSGDHHHLMLLLIQEIYSLWLIISGFPCIFKQT